MRFLIILLFLINVLVLAAWQGWLGEGQSPAEPQRLTNQLHPERIRLLDGTEPPPAPEPEPPPLPAPQAEQAAEPPTEEVALAAEAAPQERSEEATAGDTVTEAPPAEPEPAPAPEVPMACVAFEDVKDEQAALLLGDALAQPELEAQDEASTDVTSWWVHIPSQGSREGADRKVAELRGQGVKDLFAIGERGARPFTVSLGLFKSAESAAEQRRRLEKKGVTGIAIEERGTTTHRIEVRGPDEALAGWASDWRERLDGAKRADCRP